MTYSFWRKARPGTLVTPVVKLTTWNGRVREAPTAWQWMVGKKIEEVVAWLKERDYSWSVSP